MKYLNKRYVPNLMGNYTLYLERNGVIKKCNNFLVARQKINSGKLYFLLDELPLDIQEKYSDMAITEEELVPSKLKTENGKQYVYNEEGTKVLIDENTALLPIVGNFLPSDGIGAYTVINRNGVLQLKQILVCINCHWSDLFSGNTIYGKNVFCLVSDLPISKIDMYLENIIKLKETPEFLKSQNIEIKNTTAKKLTLF